MVSEGPSIQSRGPEGAVWVAQHLGAVGGIAGDALKDVVGKPAILVREFVQSPR